MNSTNSYFIPAESSAGAAITNYHSLRGLVCRNVFSRGYGGWRLVVSVGQGWWQQRCPPLVAAGPFLPRAHTAPPHCLCGQGKHFLLLCSLQRPCILLAPSFTLHAYLTITTSLEALCPHGATVGAQAST